MVADYMSGNLIRFKNPRVSLGNCFTRILGKTPAFRVNSKLLRIQSLPRFDETGSLKMMFNPVFLFQADCQTTFTSCIPHSKVDDIELQ